MRAPALLHARKKAVTAQRAGRLFSHRAGVDKLAPGGVFVLKEIGTEPRWKFERLKLQEFMSTRILRITKGDTMHFESGERLKQRLTEVGFEKVEIRRLDAGFTSPHLLLTAKRPGAPDTR